MSTIIRTEFGNYETYNGSIISISSELQRALGNRRINSPSEMQAAINRLREERNRQIQQSQSRAEQNTQRLKKQMEDMQLQMTTQINSAVTRATEQSNRRVEELKRDSQRRFEQIENNVNSSIRNLREQQNRTIRDMERRVYDSMSQMHEQLETRIDDMVQDIVDIQNNLNTTNQRIDVAERSIDRLANYVVEMEQRIDHQFEQQQQQITSIASQLVAITKRGEERANIAIEWMKEVEKNNQLDRFVPEETASVRRRLQSLIQLQASGAELASAANETIIASQELEIKCTQERLKYEQKEEMTRTMLEAVLETVNKNREIEISDDYGNPVKVENNFWSRGRYNMLLEKLKELQQEILVHGHTDMTVERLGEIQKEITKSETEIKEITAQSVQRVTLSQARMQAVYDIVGTMEEQHWQVIEENGEEEIDYTGGDMVSDFREGAFARLKNHMGEEVTVMVDPDGDQLKSTISFHFSGGIDTDEEKERKTDAVAEQLNQSGYELGVPRCAGHMPMPEMESAEAMKQQGASERIRERERINE